MAINPTFGRNGQGPLDRKTADTTVRQAREIHLATPGLDGDIYLKLTRRQAELLLRGSTIDYFWPTDDEGRPSGMLLLGFPREPKYRPIPSRLPPRLRRPADPSAAPTLDSLQARARQLGALVFHDKPAMAYRVRGPHRVVEPAGYDQDRVSFQYGGSPPPAYRNRREAKLAIAEYLTELEQRHANGETFYV